MGSAGPLPFDHPGRAPADRAAVRRCGGRRTGPGARGRMISGTAGEPTRAPKPGSSAALQEMNRWLLESLDIVASLGAVRQGAVRSEEHTSELQSPDHL